MTRSTSHSNASGYESSTIDKMCMVFSTHGLPQTLMTNHGSVFTSVHFADFVQRNIRHFTSSPHHPATNGLVEWAVQTFKGAIKKAGTTVHSVETVVQVTLLVELSGKTTHHDRNCPSRAVDGQEPENAP